MNSAPTDGETADREPRPQIIPDTLAAPEDREAYRQLARWTAIRQRQAAHDGAAVVDAYLRGYLDGMREAAEGRAVAPAQADEDLPAEEADGGLPSPAAQDTATSPTFEQLEIRARLEGYADGLRWREPARRGGLVRLAMYHAGKSARRFAAEDLMRTPRRVRRMIAYTDVVEDMIRDELLRRLSELRVDAGGR